MLSTYTATVVGVFYRLVLPLQQEEGVLRLGNQVHRHSRRNVLSAMWLRNGIHVCNKCQIELNINSVNA